MTSGVPGHGPLSKQSHWRLLTRSSIGLECLECQDHHFSIITWDIHSTGISFAMTSATYYQPVVCINTLFQMEIQSSGAIMQASLILMVVLAESVFRMASFQALAASSMSFLLCNSSGVMNSSLFIFGS